MEFTLLMPASYTLYISCMFLIPTYGQVEDTTSVLGSRLKTPLLVTVEAVNSHSLNLTWYDPNVITDRFHQRVASYTIRYRKYGTRDSYISLEAETTQKVISNLKPNTEYELNVQVQTSDQRKPGSNWSQPKWGKTWAEAPVDAPYNVTLEAGPSWVYMSWLDPDENPQNGRIIGYRILFTTDYEGDESTQGWLEDEIDHPSRLDKNNIDDRQRSILLHGKTENTLYFFRIQAKNNVGYGPLSDVVYTVTQEVQFGGLGGVGSPAVSCSTLGPVNVTGEEGFLYSLVTIRTRLGSLDCPWRIVVEEGKRIRLTVFYPNLGLDLDPDQCHFNITLRNYYTLRRYAYYERQECYRGGQREVILTSYSNKLDVFMTMGSEVYLKPFFIKYEAIGCSVLDLPSEGRWLWPDNVDHYGTSPHVLFSCETEGRPKRFDRISCITNEKGSQWSEPPDCAALSTQSGI